MTQDLSVYKHLVIADDDIDDQLILKEIIEDYSRHIKTTCLGDGKQLMDHLFKKNVPDLLFLDLNMPLKTGIQCLSEIRSDKKLKDLPVVVFSTSRNRHDMEQCFANGAQLFYSKPWDLDVFRKLIHSILDIDWQTFKKPKDKEEFYKIAVEGRLLIN